MKELNARHRQIADAISGQFEHEGTNVGVADDKVAFHTALPEKLSAEQADIAIEYLSDYRAGFALGAGEYMVEQMAKEENKELAYMQAQTNVGGVMNFNVTVRREHEVNAGVAGKGEKPQKKTVVGHTTIGTTTTSPSALKDITKYVAALAVTKF